MYLLYLGISFFISNKSSNYDEKTTNTITAYKNDVAIEDVFHEKDDYIGEATLEYIDPTSTTIEFPNYGFKLDIANY